VCYRETGGWGFEDKYLCSRTCQDIYAEWKKKMIDPTQKEKDAMMACLRPLGEIVSEQGMDFAAYSKEQALALIEVVVTSFGDNMRRTDQ